MRTFSLRSSGFFAGLAAVAVSAFASQVRAEDAKPTKIELGPYSLQAPAAWKKKEPANRIIAFEFAAPAAEGDKTDGRMTIMAAGGSVEQNIERWYGQFSQADGTATADKAKVEKKTIADQPVHIVDISGVFKDQAGPFAPAVMREDYRMLGAIIETKQGSIFLKFYGPKATIAKHEEGFKEMVNSLK